MTYRTVICVVLVVVMVALMACGQATQVVPEPAEPAEPTREPALPAPPPPPPPTGSRVVSAAPVITPNIGLLSLEVTILTSDLIVKARLNSITSDTSTDKNGKYRGIVKFNLTVSEHLRGTSPTMIAGVWIDGWPYDTRAEAMNKANMLIAGRDTQWDDREAVIFLKSSNTTTARYLPESSHYLLAWGDGTVPAGTIFILFTATSGELGYRRQVNRAEVQEPVRRTIAKSYCLPCRKARGAQKVRGQARQPVGQPVRTRRTASPRRLAH